jgi:C-terminal processing protease CtpA/Prc
MAGSNSDNPVVKANVRLCRICAWSDHPGLGFSIEAAPSPPHIIRTVDSNSPAEAGGLKILDLILAVNNQDVSQSSCDVVKNAIREARGGNNPIELLVVEQRYYSGLIKNNVFIDPTLARTIESPAVMPSEYKQFPKNLPRTCEIRLRKDGVPFGFEIVNGQNDIGIHIQEVVPDSPAGKTSLRKSDRVLEIDDTFVDNDPSRTILEKFGKAKTKGAVKLYVVDTNTYKYFKENKIPLASKDFKKGKFDKKLKTMSQLNMDDCK